MTMSRPRAPTTTAVLALLLTSLACGRQGPATSSDSGVTEGLVYTALRPENLDIYLFDAPGTEPRRLTDHAAVEYNATFSPDGRWLVFTSERNGNPDLWAMEVGAEGEPIALTRDEALDDAADFSPDGRSIAFVSTRDGNADIFVMPFDPDDSAIEKRATNLTRRPGGDFNPAFSPDGRQIAFSRQDKLWSEPSPENPAFDSNGADLYVMDADGSSPRELVGQVPGPEIEPGFAYGSVAGSPAWSDDGALVYYYRVTSEGREIRRIRLDGSGDERVVGEGLSPALAPDGRIAFTRPRIERDLDAMDVFKTGVIISVAADGSGERVVSDTLGEYFAPDFDPTTGRMVAHGPGPTEAQPGTLRDGILFAPPGGRGRARLPDRQIPVWAVRGYFPALGPEGDVISTVLTRFEPQLPLSRTAVDGSNREDIFAPDGFAWGPAIARDGGVIVVAVGPPFAPGSVEVDIWKLSLDGSDPVNLTADVSANDALPHISPDGRRIVFRTGGDMRAGKIVVTDGDGGDRRQLTDTDAAETMPALSPDGEWVVFPTDRAGGMKLWIQRVDGSEGRFLEPDRMDVPDVSMHPRFSPDGAWVVFTSNRGGFNDEWPMTPYPQPYGDLWAVSVADGSVARLTHNKWEDGPSDWGPVRLPERGSEER